MPTTMDDVGVAVGEVNTRFGATGTELENLSKEFIKIANINGNGFKQRLLIAWTVL